MNCRSTLVWLVPVVAVLAILASTAGLTSSGSEGTIPFVTVNGQTEQLYGRGLYANDTVFYAATFQGLDLVTLAVFVPALAAAAWWCFRGSWRGGVALTGMLAVFLYNSASMAFSAAYNSMFLVYVALLAASVLAFVFSFVSLDHYALADHISGRLPRRRLAGFLIVAGLAPLVLWLGDILNALGSGRVPAALGSYTTLYTYAVDLAIVVPVTFLAAFLLLRRAPTSYALTAVMLMLLASVGIGVVVATYRQVSVGIVFTPGQLIGLIGSWIILGAFAVGFIIALLRSLPDGPAPVIPLQRQPPHSASISARSAHHSR